ncbi:MAG: hypothetical protein ACI9XR_001481 [Flavobacterium sp.]
MYTYFLLFSHGESKTITKIEIDKYVQEEQKIVKFLTTTTKLNSKLLAVTDLKKSQDLPDDYLQLFTKQQQISYSFNKDIDKITTTEMVSIPNVNSDQKHYDKYELTKEQTLDTIIDNLILQVALLKTLEKQTNNEKIVQLTTTYLPKISNQIELTNTFKLNNYLTN